MDEKSDSDRSVSRFVTKANLWEADTSLVQYVDIVPRQVSGRTSPSYSIFGSR